MPYKIKKVSGGYKVGGPHGTKYSKRPQSKATAVAQLRAIAIHSRGEEFSKGAKHA